MFTKCTGLIRLQEILKYADPEHKWLVRRLIPGGDNRPLLKQLKLGGESRVILDCPPERVKDYLRQAREVQFFEDYMVGKQTFATYIIPLIFFIVLLSVALLVKF